MSEGVPASRLIKLIDYVLVNLFYVAAVVLGGISGGVAVSVNDISEGDVMDVLLLAMVMVVLRAGLSLLHGCMSCRPYFIMAAG